MQKTSSQFKTPLFTGQCAQPYTNDELLFERLYNMGLKIFRALSQLTSNKMGVENQL